MADSEMRTTDQLEEPAASDRRLVADDDSSLSGKSTTIRKLRIKIKLPERSSPTSSSDDKQEDGGGGDDIDRSKEEEEEDKAAEDHKVEAEEEQQHVCSLCEKAFRSRKALGGHMRVHAQQQRRSEAVLENQAAADASNSSGGDDDDLVEGAAGVNDISKLTICPICQREFPSSKALFGHMRCHPERSWRGIQPPPPPPVYSSSSTVSEVNKSDDDDADHVKIEKQELDLVKDLLGFKWGAKAIRGREGTVPHNPKSSSPSPPPLLKPADDELVDGIQSLILLSQGGVNGADCTNEDSLLKLSTTEKNKRHYDDGDQLMMIRPAGCGVRDNYFKGKKMKFCGAELKGRVDHDDHDDQYSGLKENRGTKRKNSSQVSLTADHQDLADYYSNKKFKLSSDINDHKGAKTAAGIRDDELQIKADHHYGYNNAGELFVMQTSDAKKKEMHRVRKYLMVNDFKGGDDSTLRLPITHPSPVKKKTTNDHLHPQVASNVGMDQRYKCTTCNKCFSSHQALGGHKSSHNKSRNSAIKATPTIRPNNDRIHPHLETQAQDRTGGDNVLSSHADHHHLTAGSYLAGISHSLHQCNVCFKVYPSGQALGGHKRLHCSSTTASSTSQLISKSIPHLPLPPPPQPSSVNAGPVVAAAAAPVVPVVVPVQTQVAESPQPAPTLADDPAAGASADKGVFSFDLNELPPLEDDNNTAAAGVQPQPQPLPQEDQDQAGPPSARPSPSG